MFSHFKSRNYPALLTIYSVCILLLNGCKPNEAKRLPVISIMTENVIEWEQSIPCLAGYAMVRENADPKGLYVVMQRLNKKVLRLNEADTGALIFKEPKVFYNDTELPSRSEGAQNYHEQKYPDFDQQDRNAAMDELRSFLLHASDEEFTNKVGTLFDLRNIADWHLLLLFTNNSDDGLLKNFYLYKVDSSTPYRIAIWDYDHSFGRDGDNEPNMLARMADEHRNILFDRLLKSPSYKKALSERWKMLRRNNIFSEENIARMMTENDAYIRSGIEENAAFWPIDAPDYFDGSDYEEEKERILQYVPLILDTLDKRFGYVNE